ncbi:cytochrome c oxidase accessory protein CcoG [Planctellipticum variicoloris]|uniref:cytochrome c oxidase accessory protein CcoG n=1 Tax=Planctellipticum variicoloris TaxID=3064265 RepID=UPI0030132B7F|nr:cytochrome c oxidase accessory protein CcoG [Planctomycetaceae bacterium SH412]
MSAMLEPEELVLSTLESDGSRRWLLPRLSKGRYWHARRLVGICLIVVFVLLPHLRIGGKPAIFLDVITRHFTFFGLTFLPTDTLLLALFMVSLFLTIFLLTAIFGRVWCGWACPQTVYLEFVYRPIERLFDGTLGKGGRPVRPPAAWKRIAKLAVYLVISTILAHTFLAYFVGVDRLSHWFRRSPVEHMVPFLVMAVTTGLMMFDFAYFREQLCLVACPYGRFQSVLLDRRSLIVAYDRLRGEPRGKPIKELPVLQDAPKVGDCVDCGLCVRTCPTGIDIRNGLQMECVHCTQCIDACDEIMDRLHRPRGLIRYACQDTIDGAPTKKFRIRMVLYPLLLLGSFGAFLTVLANRQPVDVTVLRNLGMPFVVTADGGVQNSLRIKLVNRTETPLTLSITLGEEDRDVTLDAGEGTLTLQPDQTVTQPLLLTAPRQSFTVGARDIQLILRDDKHQPRTIPCRLLGP